MINSLFDRKIAKQFNKIAKEKAILHQKEAAAINGFMRTNSKETIIEILDIVDANGHPKEQLWSKELRDKYNKGMLEFDDIITLDTLYKSNYKFFKNKDEQQ